MNWTKQGNIWRSGSYVIELVAPCRWSLTLEDEESLETLVREESEWTGRSLRAMKATAERMESDRMVAAERRRYLSVVLGALGVIALVAGLPGQLPAVVALAASAVFFFALSRFIDRFRRRPWEALDQVYQ